MYLQGQLIALFTSDAQVIAQATAVLPLIAFVMVRTPLLPYHTIVTPCKTVYAERSSVLWCHQQRYFGSG